MDNAIRINMGGIAINTDKLGFPDIWGMRASDASCVNVSHP